MSKERIVMFWGDEKQPAEYRFETEAEMRAFLLGVSECDGWMSHHGADPIEDDFVVETYTIVDGWLNVWEDDGEPTIFKGYDAACEALDEFMADMAEAYREGNIESEYDSCDYRIVPFDIAN